MFPSSKAMNFFDKAPSILIKKTRNNSFSELSNNVRKGDICVYWYFGNYGLKQGAVDFYKNALTKVLNKQAFPFLVDLTPWGRFQSTKCKLNKSNKNVENICQNNIYSLRCSDFFSELTALTMERNQPILKLIQNILQREELLKASEKFPAANISLKEVFNDNNPDNKIPIALEELKDKDAAKCYSVIQYIEFLFMVKSILTRLPDTHCIHFHLPNDEDKYYLESLEQDLAVFLKGYNINPRRLQINIDCFKYSNELSHRPYNAPGKVIKKRLGLDDIINNDELIIAEDERFSEEKRP